MPYLKWKAKLSLGLTQIDEQHHSLVDILNKLHHALMDEHNQELTEKIISDLNHFVKTHFETEERLFRELDYPDATQHMEEHDFFRKQLAEFEKSCKEGDITLLYPMMNMIKEWMVKHILVIDRKYAPFCKKNGIN